MCMRIGRGLLLLMLATAMAACVSSPMLEATESMSRAERAIFRARENLETPSDNTLLAEAEQKLKRARRMITSEDPTEEDFLAVRRLAGEAAVAAERARLQAEADATGSTEAPLLSRLRRELSALDPRHTERGITLTLGGALFGFDSADLEPAARGPLDGLAAILRERPGRRLRIEGHTDSMGDEAYNQQLSRHRAETVARELAGRGIDRGRMTVAGYGETRPVAPNTSPETRRRNRRVEVVILN